MQCVLQCTRTSCLFSETPGPSLVSVIISRIPASLPISGPVCSARLLGLLWSPYSSLGYQHRFLFLVPSVQPDSWTFTSLRNHHWDTNIASLFLSCLFSQTPGPSLVSVLITGIPTSLPISWFFQCHLLVTTLSSRYTIHIVPSGYTIHISLSYQICIL